MNKVILVGNLARDPELSTTTSGKSVCKFTIAVNRPYTSADGTREADFLSVIVWEKNGENCHKYLKKGSKAGVVGRIQTRTYDDKDGVKRYITEVVAEEVEFLSTRNSGESSYEEITDEAPKAPRKPISELKPIEDDDLPF